MIEKKKVKSKVTCFKCGKIGHYANACHSRVRSFNVHVPTPKKIIKQIWVVKGCSSNITNVYGPKKTWVPNGTHSCFVGSTLIESNNNGRLGQHDV